MPNPLQISSNPTNNLDLSCHDEEQSSPSLRSSPENNTPRSSLNEFTASLVQSCQPTRGGPQTTDTSAVPHNPPSYDCVNDCVSSLGVPTLMNGTLVALGCYFFLPACPLIISAGTGSVLGGCAAACDELESPVVSEE